MRHRKHNAKLGRKAAHLKELTASLICNLIEEKRITTTLPKARLARRVADQMVTLTRQGTLAARRRAIAILRQPKRVAKLMTDIVPQLAGRQGGYTRIIKLGRRSSDCSEMAILEWVGIAPADKKKKPAKAKAEGAAEKTKPAKE
jgi:large subunit ribosomal protein L17